MPTTFQLQVTAAKERLLDVERQLAETTTTFKTDRASDLERLNQEKQMMIQSLADTETRTSQRLNTELDKVQIERDALEVQRMHLLEANTTFQARMHTERKEGDALHERLTLNRIELTEKTAEFNARELLFHEKVENHAENCRLLELKKTQLLTLGKNTLESSEKIARQTKDYETLTQQLSDLQLEHQQLLQQHSRDTQATQVYDQEAKKMKDTYEKLAQGVHTEKLSVAKERLRSRQLLCQAQMYERLVNRKAGVMEWENSPDLFSPDVFKRPEASHSVSWINIPDHLSTNVWIPPSIVTHENESTNPELETKFFNHQVKLQQWLHAKNA